MRPVWAAVPYRDRPDLTATVADSLLADPAVERLWLIDMGSDLPDTRRMEDRLRAQHGGRVQTVRYPPVSPDPGPRRQSLYTPWNDVADRASAAGRLLAVYNNDLELLANTTGTLARALAWSDPEIACVYPDYRREVAEGPADVLELVPTTRIWPHGLSGFAFVCDPQACPRWDDGYVFYRGDWEWERALRDAGLCAAMLQGWPVGHLLGATRRERRHAGWVARAIAADKQRAMRLHPSTWRI